MRTPQSNDRPESAALGLHLSDRLESTRKPSSKFASRAAVRRANGHPYRAERRLSQEEKS